MSRLYTLAPAANRDVDQHFLYIARRNPAAAARFLRAADASFEELGAMPDLGERQRFAKESLAGLRAWQVRGFENYVIYYRPAERGILVVRVLHAARDAATILEEGQSP